MFFLTYLRLELRHRMRQAVVIAAGLAVGVALVITVTALSSGVRSAQPRPPRLAHQPLTRHPELCAALTRRTGHHQARQPGAAHNPALPLQL